MAQDQQTILANPNTWTQITNADATAITFEVIDGVAMLRFTTNTTAPTEAYGIRYEEGDGELQKSISDMTYLSGADRVWVKSMFGKPARIYVDHA